MTKLSITGLVAVSEHDPPLSVRPSHHRVISLKDSHIQNVKRIPNHGTSSVGAL